jgi:uncharacterized protein YecE (DUF72 family)
VIRCRDAASPLGNRLAAVIWQLPASSKKNVERLSKFVKILRGWKSKRHAIEFRHKSWFDDEVAECLGDHAVAVCMSDASDWPMRDRAATDMVYIRLHVYFDNDAEGAAPRNALTLLEMVRRAVRRLLLDDQPRLWSARTCPRF